jgi:outer membrane protein assembly factor BamA
MRRWLVQLVLVGIACLLTPQPTYAQRIDSNAISEAQAAGFCPPSTSGNNQSSGPDISITEVAFLGALQMSAPDQDQIAASLRQRTYTGALDGVVDEALERVRAAWQDRGYFKVQVSGNARLLTSSPVNQRIAIAIRVEEGLQYRLGQIRFRTNNNKAIGNVESLRTLFPIADGDVFSREKIAKGLENLRKAYGELGYINFTSVPDTRFVDQERLIYLDIDTDEGKQFRVGSISFPGLDETAQREVLRGLPLQPGQIFNSRTWELFLQSRGSLLDSCSSRQRLDERAGIITISLDCGQCPVD